MFGNSATGEEEFWRDIGRKIRAARKAAGITQKELADKVKISRPSIANMEVGRQGIDLWQMKKIQDALIPDTPPSVRAV